MTHTTKEEAVGKALIQLASFCDTGSALAIHIRYTRPSLLYRTYGQKWIEHYSEQGFMLSDPVVHWGLTNGWTFSFGPATSRTIAGLTKSGAPFTDAERAKIIRIVEDIHALTEGIEAFPANTQDALRSLG